MGTKKLSTQNSEAKSSVAKEGGSEEQDFDKIYSEYVSEEPIKDF